MTLRTLAAALLAAGLATAADAAEYTLLIYETPADLALRNGNGPDTAAYWAGYGAAAAAMAQAGVLLGGLALAPEGARVGAGAEPAALILGGYFRIDTPDLETARGWAARLPAAARGGAVEVRPAAVTPPM